MNQTTPLRRWQRAVSQRRAAIVLALALPPLLGLVGLAWRFGAGTLAVVVATAGIAGSALVAWHWSRRGVESWLGRRLDALAPSLEDSAALLWRDAAALTPLQRLQRERLQARLGGLDLDLRPAWPRRALAASALLALVLLAVALRPPPLPLPSPTPAVDARGPAASATRLVAAQLAVTPPAYTGLPARSGEALDARVPQDARLDWRLRFAPQPSAVWLAFHDGSRLDLQRHGDDWRGGRTLAASSLYRIGVEAAAPLTDPLHRIDVSADLAPTIRILEPQQSLTTYDGRQARWPLLFEAADDYGLASAELSLTHAQGTGESIRFSEQSVPLQGEALDGARRQRYRHEVDLAALKLAAGDEVIARLIVGDNRTPTPNITRSPALILRWSAPPAADAAGVDGISQQVLPAYFRSQRQIIIDTETLLAEQDRLDPARLLARSDAIGVDQKILRLRYGQFLGEEAEGAAAAAVEAGHAEADSQLGALAQAHEASERAATSEGRFGVAGDVLAQYGHVHDIAEAATLLDAGTRATLKAALDAMWQAELHLRQGAPAAALPHEQRALEFIKQAQQATRIYLARVGLELPPPDETRRLSGERKGVTDVTGSLAAASDATAPLVQLWQALALGTPPDWDGALHALGGAAATDARSLDVLAALDRAQHEPDCAECRQRLRAALWPLLPTPAAQVLPREAADAAGATYLDALPAAAGARP